MSKPAAPPSEPAEGAYGAHDPLAVATLAVQMIPLIALPDGWETEHPDRLRKRLAESITPFAPEWASSFDVVCEIAAERARILLDAAAGRKRPERVAHEAAGREAKAGGAASVAESGKLASLFDRHAKGRVALPLNEFLKIALPKSERRDQYWHEYRRDGMARGEESRNPSITVTFRSEATPEHLQGAEAYPAKCIILEDLEDEPNRTIKKDEFPRAYAGFRLFYDQHGERLRKEWQREASSRGGLKTQRKRIASEDKRQVQPITKAGSRTLDSKAKRLKRTSLKLTP